MSSTLAGPRLVVVFGHSGRRDGLHAVCAARLRRAEMEAGPNDVVLLSGWSRRRRSASEAELMAEAWDGPSAHLVLDRGARTTLANAVGAAAVASERGAREVVLVTSGMARATSRGAARRRAGRVGRRGRARAHGRARHPSGTPSGSRVLVDRARPEAARESAGERAASASRRC